MTDDTFRSLVARLRRFNADTTLLQSAETRTMVEELAWMLARQREAFKTQRRQAKHARLAVRRRSALATTTATLRQWRA